MGVVNVRLEELQKSLNMNGRREADALSFDRFLCRQIAVEKNAFPESYSDYYRGRWRPNLPCSPDESIW